MAVQLEVVKYRDLLQVHSIPRVIPGVSPLTIEVKGVDFSTVAEVIINSVPSPEFVIINKQTMWVQLPDAAQNGISTIEVLSSKFTRTIAASKVLFQLGDKTRAISGLPKLVQLFVKWLLQSPGSDIYDPSRGGGLQAIVGRINSTRDMKAVTASITRAVDATVTQVRNSQVNQTKLAMSERLLSASLQDINVFEKQMEARARVRIISMAGPEAVAEIGL